MLIKTITEAFNYIESFTNLEKEPNYSVRTYRIDRMEKLLKIFGNPEKGFKSVHIAGSKGKGSTAVFISSILASAGIKTGLFVSPHISSYKERITVSGKEPEDEIFTRNIQKIKLKIDNIDLPAEDPPTTFELLTLLAFLIFKETGCEWAVIETGIGGRLDATNVLLPEICVLTSIELEHTNLLGDTITSIAKEKGGIIKKGVPVVCGFQNTEAEKVFINISSKKKADLIFLKNRLKSLDVNLSTYEMKVHLVWHNEISQIVTLKMPAKVQAENAALALLTVKSLSEIGKLPPVSEKIMLKGAARAWLPCRMEIIKRTPTVVLDGAHTPASITSLLDSFKQIFSEPGVLLFGAVSGKQIKTMAEILAPAFKKIIISTPGTFKKSNPENVYNIFKKINPDTILELSPAEALKAAVMESKNIYPVLVTGSFYMTSEIRKEFTSHAF